MLFFVSKFSSYLFTILFLSPFLLCFQFLFSFFFRRFTPNLVTTFLLRFLIPSALLQISFLSFFSCALGVLPPFFLQLAQPQVSNYEKVNGIGYVPHGFSLSVFTTFISIYCAFWFYSSSSLYPLAYPYVISCLEQLTSYGRVGVSMYVQHF